MSEGIDNYVSVSATFAVGNVSNTKILAFITLYDYSSLEFGFVEFEFGINIDRSRVKKDIVVSSLTWCSVDWEPLALKRRTVSDTSASLSLSPAISCFFVSVVVSFSAQVMIVIRFLRFFSLLPSWHPSSFLSSNTSLLQCDVSPWETSSLSPSVRLYALLHLREEDGDERCSRSLQFLVFLYIRFIIGMII